MTLQGQSTLTDAEKVTEARKLVESLEKQLGKLAPNEQRLVQSLSDNFRRYGAKTMVSNAQIFWLRDINQSV